MISHPIASTRVTNTLAILQLNCRRSHSITNSLFNDANIANFSFLALQEPPVNSHTNRPSEQSGWHLVVCQPKDNREDSRPRSCIYVKKNNHSSLQPIDCQSRDVSACTITVANLTLLLVNVYNQPSTFRGFEDMDTALRHLPTSLLLHPTIVVTDSNLHSALWNPATYHSQDAAADSLMEMMLHWNLHLRSPKGVLTYEAKRGISSGTTIDLVWMNQQAEDRLIECLVDTDDVLNHHSDHKALVTVGNIKCDNRPVPETYLTSDTAWHKVDQATFLSELKALLPPALSPSTHTDITSLDQLIVSSITTALNKASPPRNAAFRHKAWWNPTLLNPLRQEAAKARRRVKSHPSEESEESYQTLRNKYMHAIEREKINSWRRDLSTLTVDTLFQARKHAMGTKSSTLISTSQPPAGRFVSPTPRKLRRYSTPRV